MDSKSLASLRSFALPPVELQLVIEAIAEHVAEEGPAAEFRLRSGSGGRRQYPFLFLDNEYAPFYQNRLKDIRKRQKTNEIAPNSSFVPTVTPNDPYLEPQQHDPPVSAIFEESPNQRLAEINNLKELSTFTYEDQYLPDHSFYSSREGSTTHNSEDNRQAGHSQKDQTKTTPYFAQQGPQCHSPATNKPPNLQIDLPYGLLQEVHLLDSSGFEQTGLNTFIVIGNNDEDAEEPLMSYLLQPPDRTPPKETIYRLRPDISTVFRTSHNRILPVGLPLGAEVQQQNKIEYGIVIRRTVQEWRRFYDVKDAYGIVHKDVAENDLQLSSGGILNFRLPHEL